MKLFLPFAIASIPFAFWGATISLDPLIYKRILGVILLFPVLKLFGVFGERSETEKKVNVLLALFVGACIGLFSGMVGIGGGIILSPIILLLHWGDMKQTAAVSALFIFVNSVAGLGGLYFKGFEFNPAIFNWIAVALLGGLLGAYAGRHKLNNAVLSKVLAFVLLIASAKLMLV